MSVGALGLLARLALVAIMAMRIGFWVYGMSVCRRDRRDRRGEAAVFLAVTVVLVAIEVAAIGYLGGW